MPVFVVVEGSDPNQVADLCGRLLVKFTPTERTGVVKSVEYLPRGSSPFVRPKVQHPCSHMLLDRVEVLEYDSHLLKTLKDGLTDLVIVSDLFKQNRTPQGLPMPNLVLYIENPGRDEKALEFVAFAKAQGIKNVRCVKPTDNEERLMYLVASFVLSLI